MTELVQDTDKDLTNDIVMNTITTNEIDTSAGNGTMNTEEANRSMTDEEMLAEDINTGMTENIPEPSTSIETGIKSPAAEHKTNINENEAQKYPNELETTTTSKIPNDSNLDTSKVKSRELKSLLDAAKESNLDTNIIRKRESKKSEAFGAVPSIVSTITKRRYSSSSTESHHSVGKRNMRSQNPEFVQKHRKFLKTVTGQNNEDSDHENATENLDAKEDSTNKEPSLESKTPQTTNVLKTPKRKRESNGDNIHINSEEKKTKKTINLENLVLKKEKDKFCWRCHRDKIQIQCETCPRSYHVKCLKQTVTNPEHWPCPECVAIIRAESTKTRSPAMKDMTQENLCELLKFALKQMMNCAGSEPFIHPVDIKSFPDYRTYVIQPMDLTTLENNIRCNVYGSTVAFTADAKWILHNSIIFNSHQSKLTTAAKNIIKICKQEMNEIETCTECYLNANTKKNSWFVEVCSKPHILLWAKLRGFPYWPAKGMVANGGVVDVRFFGAHDRAWVPVKECFLYSKKDPNTTNKHKRTVIAECIKEVDTHIEKLKSRYGEFKYAPYRMQYDPFAELEQLQVLLPKYKPSGKFLYKFSQRKIKIDNKPKRIKTGIVDSENHTDNENNLRNEYQKHVAEKLNSSKSIHDLSDFSDDTENLLLTPIKRPSKPSVKSDKSTLKCITISDFDKFMEGYGTEDDEYNAELNPETDLKQFTSEYGSDSDDELNSSMEKESKNGDESMDDADKSSASSSETSVTNRGMVRTRGGYHNVSGKIKVIGRKSGESETAGKRCSEESPEVPSKFQKKDNDTFLITSELDKVNKIGEFPENLELTIGNKFKEVMQNAKKLINKKKRNSDSQKDTSNAESDGNALHNNKKEVKSPQIGRPESITDKLIKRMSISHDNDNDKVEIVKKQILDNLEATSSILERKIESDDNKIEEIDERTQLVEKTKSNLNLTSNKEVESETKLAAADSQNNLSNDDDSDTEHYLHLTSVKKPFSSTPKSVKNYSLNNEEEKIKQSLVTNSNILINKDITEINNKQVLENDRNNDNASSDDLSSNEDELDRNLKRNDSPNSCMKIVSVGDIMFGKRNNSNCIENKTEKKPQGKSSTNSITEEVEIKSEPLSDSESDIVEKSQPNTTSNEKQKNKSLEKPQENRFRIVDNLTRIIDCVATNSINKIDTNVKPSAKVSSPIQRARKTFPTTFVTKPLQTVHIKKLAHEKKDNPPTSTTTQTFLNTTPNNQSQIYVQSKQIIAPTAILSTVISSAAVNKPSTENLMYINPPTLQTPVVLPPNQPLSLSQSVSNPILAVVQQGTLNNTNIMIQHPATSATVPTIQPAQCNVTGSVETVTSIESNSTIPSTIDLSEDLSRVIGDLMCNKVPPKLKPKPPGPLSTHFDEGNPSNIGPVTKIINSVAHRLADYFRGLLVETLTDLTNMNSPEAKIRSLELEIENLKHKQTEEMLEFRKNISTILKEIQKSIVEEKNKIMDETRAACEIERLRSVEEAKSKQWCAYCLKEAQFYCCWNTSYCDYPCQQKHWATHMKTCSQSTVRTNNTAGTTNTTNKTVVAQATLKTVPKQYTNPNKLVKQAARMYIKPTATTTVTTSGTKTTQMFFQRPVQLQTTSLSGQSTLTLVESTPGNFEIVGNHGPISLDGKLIPATSVIGKVKTATVVTSTTAGINSSQTTHKAIILTQKANPISKLPTIVNKDNSTENKS